MTEIDYLCVHVSFILKQFRILIPMKNFLMFVISLFIIQTAAFAQWQKILTTDKGGSSVHVMSIDFDDNGVWVGVHNGGVKQFTGIKETASFTKESGLLSDKIRAIAVDKTGRKWIATDNGLDMWDGKKFTHNQKNDITLLTNDITALHVDDDNQVWVGTDKGLVRINGDRWSVFDTKNTNKLLPSNSIRAIHSNWRGAIWVATDEGLAQFNGKTWKNYNQKLNGLPSNDIHDVFVASDGIVWVATEKGVGKFDEKICTQYLKDIPASSITMDLAGNVWVASEEDGIYKIQDGKEKAFTVKDGLASDEGLVIECDPYGDIWAGTKTGLNQFTDKDDAVKIASALFQKAEEFRVLGDDVNARKFYDLFFTRDYLKQAQEIPLVIFALEQMSLKDEQLDKVKELAKKFLAQFPTHGKAKQVILDVADLSAELQKVNDAQMYYQQYLDTYPDDPVNPEILWKMASLFEKDGDSFGAARLYQKLNNKYPDNSRYNEIRWIVANMEEKQKGPEVSQPVYNDLAAASDDYEILYRVGDAYDMTHREDIMKSLKGGIEWKNYATASPVNYFMIEGNNLWIGTQNNGAVKWDMTMNALTSYTDGLSGQNVTQIYLDSDRDLWAIMGGLTKNTLYNMNYSRNKSKWIVMGSPFNTRAIRQMFYRPKTKSVVAATDQGLLIGGKSFTSRNGMPSDNVKFVIDDSKGVLWLIADKYLVQLDKEPKVIVNTGDIDFSEVRDFYIDANDTKWLATNKGVAAYDGAWRIYTTKDGLVTDVIQCVSVSKSGKVIAGTKSGMSFFNKTFWINYTTANGLPSNDVKVVKFSDDESIWIGTDKGVHLRKSSGDGDRYLMVQSVLIQEELLWKQKKFSEARALYPLLRTYSDLDEWIAFKKAVCLEKEGKIDEAQAAYLKIRMDNPVTVWATDFYLYRIARKYEAANKPDKAMVIYNELAEKMRTEMKNTYRIEESLVRVADTYLANKNTEVPLGIYKQVAQTFPNSVLLPKVGDRMCSIGKDYELKKEYDKAIAVYLDFLVAFADDARAPQVKLSLAQIYFEKNRIADAERFYLNLSMFAPEPIKSISERRLAKVQRMIKQVK
ncbi:tetratricopeptide repeat protein [bacterium]|nr:MAG: tetratricopeptide repeat protein [bacterium]